MLKKLHWLLMGYMARAGLILFADEPNLMAGDAPAATPAAGAAPAAEPAAPAAAASAAAAPAAADKPAEPAPKDGETKAETKPEDKPVAKAPEKYEFAAPEGFVVDEALAAEFTPVLRDLDLTQEQADKLVAFAPRMIAQSVDAAVAKTLESIGYGGAKDWAAAAKADKEFGGDKLAENMGVAKAARDQFATPELRKLLESTPLGNNPEIVRLFYRVGKAISADGYVPAGKTKQAASPAQAMYTESKMNP